MSGYLFLVAMHAKTTHVLKIINKPPSLRSARPHRHRGHKKASETGWPDLADLDQPGLVDQHMSKVRQQWNDWYDIFT